MAGVGQAAALFGAGMIVGALGMPSAPVAQPTDPAYSVTVGVAARAVGQAPVRVLDPGDVYLVLALIVLGIVVTLVLVSAKADRAVAELRPPSHVH